MTKKSKKAAPNLALNAVPLKLNKTTLTDMVAEQTGLSQKDIAGAFDALMESVVVSLRGGKDVTLPGIGTLKVKATAARIGVRPGTSERIQIPAGKKVSFTMSSTLKNVL